MITSYLMSSLWLIVTMITCGLEFTEHSLHLDEIRPSIILAWNVLGIALLIVFVTKL